VLATVAHDEERAHPQAANTGEQDPDEAQQRVTDGHQIEARKFLAALPATVIRPAVAAMLVIVAILSVTWFREGGGLEAVSYVYRHHASRLPNPSSLVSALVEPARWAVFPADSGATVARVLQLLQFGPALLLALAPVRSRRALLLGCLTVVLGFTLFGKVFSPQWICWISPLAVLLAPSSWVCLALLVLLEGLLYLQMPVLYYEALTGSSGSLHGARAFWAVCDLRIAVLFLFWAWSLSAFLRTVVRPAPTPGERP
jgi:hypothetical protein